MVRTFGLVTMLVDTGMSAAGIPFVRVRCFGASHWREQMLYDPCLPILA
jgi:hypothetical protein